MVPADLEIPAAGGGRFRWSSAQARVVVVVFWSLDPCPYTRALLKRLGQFLRDYERPEVEVLFVIPTVTKAGRASRPASRPGTTLGPVYPDLIGYGRLLQLRREILVDDAASLRTILGARTTPQFFVLDRTGRLAYSGTFDDDPLDRRVRPATSHLRLAVEAVLAGEDPPIGRTEPFG